MAPDCSDGKISPPGRLTTVAPGSFDDLPAETRHAHLEALVVVHRVDLLVEPSSHLHARVAHGIGLEVEIGVQSVPQLLSAAIVDPTGHLVGVESVRDRGKELRRRAFALPVVGGRVSHLRRTLRNGVEGFEGRNQFPTPVDFHRQAAAGHPVDDIGEVIGSGPQARKVLRPGGDHLPAILLLGVDRGGAGDKRSCRKTRRAHRLDEAASFHFFPPSALASGTHSSGR